MSQNPVLITGGGLHRLRIGAHRLLQRGRKVMGLDSVNDYYDPALTSARLAVLSQFSNFTFHKGDLATCSAVRSS